MAFTAAGYGTGKLKFCDDLPSLDDSNEADRFGGGLGTLGARDLTACGRVDSAISSELHRECLGLSTSAAAATSSLFHSPHSILLLPSRLETLSVNLADTDFLTLFTRFDLVEASICP